MTISPPPALVEELTALGPSGRRRAATSAAAMFAADVSTAAPVIDPVPVVLDAESWSELSAGLLQRVRLLDALYKDLYGPRTVLAGDIAPVGALLSDPAYLRPAVGMPARGAHHLFAVTTTVSRTADGAWVVHEDTTDVPRGAGIALELRRVLSRSAPTLYRSTPVRRLHPYFDMLRTSLHHRTRADGRPGRTVVLADDSAEPLTAFDHSWLANLLGAPMISVGDLRTGSGTLTLRLSGLASDPGDSVDAVLRLIPSQLLDPLDLGPTPLGGVTGLVEAARCGDVELLNPLGAGLLENAQLREALPDLCRQMLHEDLLLRPAGGAEPAGWLCTDPAGGDELVERPARLTLLVMATEDGYEVLPGGIARTADEHPETLKDVWVTVAESAAVPDEEPVPPRAADLPDPSRAVVSSFPAMTRSVGSDLFWFGRYLERVDSTARLLRTILDTSNDLGSERGRSARTARTVLLRTVTEVTTTYPGFHDMDLQDPESVGTEILSLLTDLSRPGSLAQSYAALAHTTRTLRELISDDVWPIITRMRTRVVTLASTDHHPLEQGLTELIDGCLTLSGAVADAMPRDLGWDLTEIGRKIERTMSLIALLRATLGHRRTGAAEVRIGGAVAQITESSAAYRRTFLAGMQSELLVELLLSDATLPRSIAFQLDRLGQALDRLPELTPSPELRAPLSELRSRIASWEPQALLRPLEGATALPGPGAGVPTPLLQEADAAMESLRELATALENRYFRPSEATSRWGVDDV
ncbi:circularly permuted type 2 ATP-grasp protein [Brachybacterium aquaticum]|uniref:Putative circularly permuted ATP-grasp superfamily protein/putative alpha-E superfamily protein n=1 Tax=Brachybacterium aquaticum TaxID=1432564 RepID=A0A841ABX1_9MICO|nr:circularly permuted type 2 ATP-grasp protein [Brachybacterium aquaticum]MBB5832326.1 putative circularly permuted ATP-grasp superfamily protein/putative alpha-E superfamily protein [Brachybacterium aquaticum]